ncbi:antibiotic biosynthesis monooxygenase family protein [Yinghuangia aomiensis]
MIAFVNRLELTGSAEELERIYAHAAAFMETQPGFLRYAFVRSRKDPSVSLQHRRVGRPRVARERHGPPGVPRPAGAHVRDHEGRPAHR